MPAIRLLEFDIVRHCVVTGREEKKLYLAEVTALFY